MLSIPLGDQFKCQGGVNIIKQANKQTLESLAQKFRSVDRVQVRDRVTFIRRELDGFQTQNSLIEDDKV